MTRVALVLALACFGAGCSRAGLKVPMLELDAAVDAAVIPPEVCIEVPPNAGPLRAALTLPVQLSVVDLFLLIDASGSMSDEIANVRQRLQQLVVPRVRQRIAGASFGLAFFGEFPVEPHGNRDVRPFEMRVSMTTDPARVEAALASVPDWSNMDFPEAMIEGLYQVTTGEGLDTFIDPSPGCARGGEGGACFRSDALPVVMVITDAPSHNGPPGVEPVSPYAFSPRPHRYQETIDAMRARGIKVIGLGASDRLGPSPLPHLSAIATATASVDSTGRPFVYSIGDDGSRVGNTIVEAVEELASGLPLDVSAFAQDVPGDAFDARTLITAIRPLSADPPNGVQSIDAESFLGTQPGTRVTFEIEVDVSSLPSAAETRRIPATILFRAADRATLATQDVLIVIPGQDGGGCEDAGVLTP